jgi:hypothetical protein
MRKILLVFGLLVLALPAWSGEAQQEKQDKEPLHFDFRGYRIGDPLPPAIAHIHGCDKQPLPEHVVCAEPLDLIGDMVGSVQYTVTRGRLVQVLILLGLENFSTMQTALTEKYGAPHEKESITMKTPVGMYIPTEIAIWRTDSDELILHKYGTDIRTGFVEVRFQKRAPTEQKRVGEEAKKAAQGF